MSSGVQERKLTQTGICQLMSALHFSLSEAVQCVLLTSSILNGMCPIFASVVRSNDFF